MRWSRLFGTDIRVSTRFTSSSTPCATGTRSGRTPQSCWRVVLGRRLQYILETASGSLCIGPESVCAGSHVIPVSVLKGFKRARRELLQCQIHLLRGFELVKARALPDPEVAPVRHAPEIQRINLVWRYSSREKTDQSHVKHARQA